MAIYHLNVAKTPLWLFEYLAWSGYMSCPFLSTHRYLIVMWLISGIFSYQSCRNGHNSTKLHVFYFSLLCQWQSALHYFCRVCRLKKKANNEANKVKLHHLRREHGRCWPMVMDCCTCVFVYIMHIFLLFSLSAGIANFKSSWFRMFSIQTK
mgnify:FL=1